MVNEFIAGLDIGTTKIACLIGQRADDGKIKILGYACTKSIGVEHGVVRNISLTAESVKKAIESASQQANVRVTEVYVGIAGQHIKSIPSQGIIMIPEEHKIITKEDVERLRDEQHRVMLGPGDEIIHIFPQTYYVDNNVLSNEISPIGVAGKQLKADFHIVTGNAQNICNIRDSVLAAGYKVKDLILEPVASSYAVLDERDKEAGVALVDIGGGTTDIAIFDEGIIRHTSVIPLAGQSITGDIRRGCSILPDQAESLKVKYGSCLPANERDGDAVSIPGIRNQPPKEISLKVLANIIKARVQTIMEQVGYEITSSGYNGKKLIAGLVLTGGGANLKYIKELASLITGMDTRVGLPNEHLLTESDSELSHPKYATGIGLVLYGMEKEEASSVFAKTSQNMTMEGKNTEANPPAASTISSKPGADQSILDILNGIPSTSRETGNGVSDNPATATAEAPQKPETQPVKPDVEMPKTETTAKKKTDDKEPDGGSMVGKITDWVWKKILGGEDYDVK